MLQFFMIMTKSKQQVRPDSLLQGTWSNLYLCWSLCLLCFAFVFRFIDFWDCWQFFIVIFTKLLLFLSWTYLLLLVNKEDTFRRNNKLSFPPLWIAIFFSTYCHLHEGQHILSDSVLCMAFLPMIKQGNTFHL